MNKLLIICGLTATGKTDLGIYLAKKFDGEIVSADSRQVYQGMDIITGKDLPKHSKLKNAKLNMRGSELSVGFREKGKIPVWLVDIVKPDYAFNVGEYARLANRVIGDIWSRQKLPIVVGGTGLYIRSIIEKIDAVIIPPNKLLRSKFEQSSKEELQQALIEADPYKWDKMNQSDRENPRRLIRAIEIACYYKTHKKEQERILNPLEIDSLLMIGLKAPYKYLFEKIDKRIEQRIKDGAVEEIKTLLAQNYSPVLPAFSALGCREIGEYLQNKESLADVIHSWKFKEYEYARRQMTWFNQNKEIKWFNVKDQDCQSQIEALVYKWYTG